MSNSYEAIYPKIFQKSYLKYKHLKKRIEVLVQKIILNPKAQSHILHYKDGIDLRGKRRRHLSPNFVIVYIICDECIEEDFKGKKFNDCSFCDEQRNRIIFLAFDKFEDIYSKEYRV